MISQKLTIFSEQVLIITGFSKLCSPASKANRAMAAGMEQADVTKEVTTEKSGDVTKEVTTEDAE